MTSFWRWWCVAVLVCVFGLAGCTCGDDDDDDDDSGDDDAVPDDDTADDDTDDDSDDDDDTTPPTGLTDHQNEVCWDGIASLESWCGSPIESGDIAPAPPYCGECDDDISCAVWACFADFLDSGEYANDCYGHVDALRDCREKHDPCWPTHPDYYFGNPDCA